MNRIDDTRQVYQTPLFIFPMMNSSRIALLLLDVFVCRSGIMNALALGEAPGTPVPPPPPVSTAVWSLASPSILCRRESCTSGDNSDAASESSSTPSTSMNIVTFCIPVSVSTPKLWMISLYHGTLTKDSFCSMKEGVLQLLCPAQKHLVPVLGKRSGYEWQNYSKKEACSQLGYGWVCGDDDSSNFCDDKKSSSSSSTSIPPIELLPECASYIRIKLVETMEAGDHLAVLCEVTGTGSWDPEKQRVVASIESPSALDHNTALYTGQLRKEGIL